MIVLCKRDRLSLAEDRGLLGVLLCVDRALPWMGTNLEQVVLKDILRLSR